MSENNLTQGKVASREERRKVKKEQEPGKVREGRKRIRIRLIPIWLRLVIVLSLIALSAAAGAMFGYGVLGGEKPTDVFEESTWTHIKDLVNKDK